MKFQFKNQEYQDAAVKSVVDVFEGQPCNVSRFTRDLGVFKGTAQTHLAGTQEGNDILSVGDDDAAIGYSNNVLTLSDENLLENINKVQRNNDISLDSTLIEKNSVPELDIEMETGTGKTFVYIKTMFELNKHYGFTKFIVIVPSIAIREGVYKTFRQTQDFFMKAYQKKIRFFMYDSSKLENIDEFAKASTIQAMVINIQAFNVRGKDMRRINTVSDRFYSRRPIDVIAQTRPILILDEPQKMGGEATRSALKQFKPLFMLNYSATHKEHHNLVYVLDAKDAYNQKLVKQIEVKGIEVTGINGTTPYMFLERISVYPNQGPKARLEYLVRGKSGIVKKLAELSKNDDLFQLSRELEVYHDRYVISDIDADHNTVTFVNGITLTAGQTVGDVNEDDIRRIQIRETIESHLEKERELFGQGIKVLSLFFIDEVAKYRQYDSNGDELPGTYAKMFEEEYSFVCNELLNQLTALDATPSDLSYAKYLEKIPASQTHNGYFSKDKKGRLVNPSVKHGKEDSDDESAYELILRDKERLLSFEEPTRFIFSHSALREGWDNPNVFQICTLRHTKSTIQKRQEVGRGLRICVNQNGVRMDNSELGDNFFNVNRLTVVANEEYSSYVKGLQAEIQDVLYKRPDKITADYFKGKTIVDPKTKKTIEISQREATIFYRYLTSNNYLDLDDHLTPEFQEDLSNNHLAPFSGIEKEIEPIRESLFALAEKIYNPTTIDDMVADGRRPSLFDNKLNARFYSSEFQKLWNEINHKSTYRVSFDSEELIRNSIDNIEANLTVSPLVYSVRKGVQKTSLTDEDIQSKTSFKETTNSRKTKVQQSSYVNSVKYDLVGILANGTHLTRKTILRILKGLDSNKFAMFRINPEEFIAKAMEAINAEKASVIVDHITYNRLNQTFDNNIFTAQRLNYDRNRIIRSKKSIQEYIVVDGYAQDGNSVEKNFASELETAENVRIYAKLPKGFYIPTPMGNYSPDWAIVYDKDDKREIYFIAETKGSLNSLDLRRVEDGKINCAKRLFNGLPNIPVIYEKVTKYEDLLKAIYEINN